MKRFWVLAGVAALLLAAPAYGDGFDDWEANTARGLPTLAPSWSTWRDAAPVAFDSVDVFRCPGGVCEATPMARKRYGEVDTAVAAPGDVFEGRWMHTGVVVHTARTPVWNGAQVLLQPAALQGTLTTGATVSVIPGQWSGGWSAPWGPWTENLLAVCRTASATECFALGDLDPVVLEARWAGWYAFVRTSYGSGHSKGVAAQIDLTFPYPMGSLYQSESAVATGPLGPIATPAAAPAPKPTPPPTAAIRARALRSEGRLLVARVSCEARCFVQLKVSGGHRPAVHRTLSVTGAKALTVPVRHGKLNVRIRVNGKLVTSGPTLAR